MSRIRNARWASCAARIACSALAGAVVLAQAPPPSPFAKSLALRTDRIVADSSHVAVAWLTQTSPATYAATGPLRLRMALVPWEGDATVVKDLGSVAVYGGDLAATPVPVVADVRGVADGYYRYRGELHDGDALLATLERPVVLVAGLESKQAAVTLRLAKIQGHDSAKATVLYPFDLARVINIGKRVFGSNNSAPEFGLSQAGVQQRYDFPAGLKRSSDLLTTLEAGRDSLWRAKGESVRHYHMAEADEILPYHVFVPSSWDGRSALPLVFILHGNSRDQDFYFDRDDHIIPKTAAKHGFMLVAPLGYWPNGGYNYVPFTRERGARAVAAAPQQFGPSPAAPPANGGRGAGAAGGVNGSVTPALVRAEWSEQDAMHVFDLVKQEYPIDPKRTFLFGYSAGGQGAHYFAQKYAGNWVAVAIGGSGATAGPYYDSAKIGRTPMLLVSGAVDPALNATRAMAQALKEKGVDVSFKEYAGQNHDTTPGAATPDIFAFFAAHARQ
ncbi:MAG: dienelactone hydrolase family protein [Vicinamibacterales bacterium]